MKSLGCRYLPWFPQEIYKAALAFFGETLPAAYPKICNGFFDFWLAVFFMTWDRCIHLIAITFWLSCKKMLKEITLHCERGWGNEHGERQNEKWEQKRELEMKLLLGFIFIFPVTKPVARSPLTSQLYMNIDFKRGEYNIFLRIYYLGRISFLADCFILHIYMTWDTKKKS